MIFKGIDTMTRTGQDSLGTRRTLKVDGKEYDYFSLKAAAEKIGDISRLPYTLKVLLENLLRFEDGRSVTTKDVQALADWLKNKKSDHEIAYRPARVLMQDFTGVPAVVDLAAMREAMAALGGNVQSINPLSTGGSGHRPFGDGRRIRQPQGFSSQCRAGVRAQQRKI